jgi:sRNA-binding carbon storage regulator CsrA
MLQLPVAMGQSFPLVKIRTVKKAQREGYWIAHSREETAIMDRVSDVSSVGGLVVRRTAGQSVLIGSDIRVVVLRKNRLKIIAPKSVRVVRGEIAEANDEGNTGERGCERG